MAGIVLASGSLAQERQATDTSSAVQATVRSESIIRGPGTQSFDNDTPVSREGSDGGTVGNLFFNSNPTANVTVSQVEFALAGNYSTSVVMTIWDVNTGSAMVAARQLVTGATQSPATAARFTANVTAAPMLTGPFVAGIRNSDYAGCVGNTGLSSTCDGVALTAGASPAPTVPGRGQRINFTSAAFVPTINTVATSGQALPGNVNAIFRVTGSNLPVELMRMEVE